MSPTNVKEALTPELKKEFLGTGAINPFMLYSDSPRWQMMTGGAHPSAAKQTTPDVGQT